MPDSVEDFVERLFVNGQGEVADRLVLTTEDGRDLGGWCREAIIDRLQEWDATASPSGALAAAREALLFQQILADHPADPLGARVKAAQAGIKMPGPKLPDEMDLRAALETYRRRLCRAALSLLGEGEKP